MRAQYTKEIYWIQVVLLCIIMLFSVWGPPSLGADSFEYLHFSPIRPPLYPLFLWIFSIFGQYQFVIVKWVQGIIMTATLLYVWYWLCDRLKMSRCLAWLILVIVAWNIVIRFEINLSILSEGLAFPLFIVCSTLFVDCFKEFNFKKAVLFVIAVNLLVLTRAQFYYFYVLFPCLIAWYFWKHVSKAYLHYITVMMLVSFFVAMVLNHAYHYYFNGHFSDSAVVGPQIIAAPLFLSSASAEKYITDPNEKIFFNKTMKLLENKHLTRDTDDYYKDHDNDTMYFKLVFQGIFHYVYYENLKDMSKYQLNTITLDISKKLYLAEFKKNLAFYLWKVISIFGELSLFMVFVFMVVMYLLRILNDRNYNPDYFQIFIGSSSLIVLLNVFFVVIFVIASERYFIYSNFLIFCIGGILADKLFGFSNNRGR